ncbi:SIMPL domain-containing protein [Mycobacterium yunnanensis]|uniref:SIMPL domain-containing protein n=1 Tax=Mycobacterium yunnanensis TaxID=368477 RepID=A0A9X3BUI0_9MYCO|nr:SIMPL domain-containing protein [Mycobacterium yunnanensis]MCV7422285.1 SIMPL domain-containing protein [Mycobacterium yunnanensis]
MPKPLTRLLLLAGAAVTAVAVVGCDSTPAPSAVPGTAAPRQVTVIGEGKVDGTPDTLVISLSIAATAPDAISASNQTSSRANAVTDAIAAQGVDRKDISTTTVTLQPQYGGADNTTIVGYQSSNSIDVKVRKIENGPQVLGVITTTGGDATRINSVTYSIEDDSQLVKDARGRAFDDAKNRAQQYAQLSGLDLGKVLSISETGGVTPPPPSPVRYDVAAAAPLSPGQQTVGFAVTVVWELG